ncbi:MAG TPA: hypothetical protein PKD51_01555 [Saprospiraceae bacterium]|nr:hypothetical protein [Saprospiraceae bacterium]
MRYLTFVFILFLLTSCHQKNEKVTGDWIIGTEADRIKTIEKQFRGFDNAMVETGYRYQELYWAGHDENWQYADYQLEKIKIAIEYGLERRPKRAKSAEHFVTNVLPEMKSAVAKKDTTLFNQNFKTLTVNCNSCHVMEKVSFFNVQPPTYRNSPIRK